MVRVLRFKVPKPRNCLGLIDLQTATEVITIFTLINKVSGFYGILSLFTGVESFSRKRLTLGAEMSPLQMSMYVWSIFGTVVCLWALKQIRNVRSYIDIDAN
jgi:inositol phosphorylceramide synthase regulatory subunit